MLRRRADPRRPAAPGARACCRWRWPRRRAGIDRIFVPEPQAGEAALVPGMSVFGVRSLAQVAAVLQGDRGPRRAARSRPLASGPLLTWRGEDRLADLDLRRPDRAWPTRASPLEVAAAGGHHLMLDGPPGAGKTHARRADPRDPARPDRRGGARAHRGALAGRRARRRRRADHAARRSWRRTTPPRGRACSAAAPARCGPASVSRAHCGVLFLDEFPLFARRHPRGAAPAARERARSRSPAARRPRPTPPAAMFVLACNPCPCGNFHRRRVVGPLQLPGGAAPRLPPQAQRPGHRPDRHHPARAAGAGARGARPAAPRPSRRRWSGPGSPRRGACSSGGTPALPWRLNGQAPGPLLREAGR